MNEPTVLFKVRPVRFVPGFDWKSQPVFISLTVHYGSNKVSADDIDAIARTISARFGGAQVRWNYQGFTQGHYVQSENTGGKNDTENPDPQDA